MRLKIKILDDRIGKSIPLPSRTTDGAAGLDLRACLESNHKPLKLYPGETKLIPTGIAIHIEDPKACSVLLPRSGLGHKQGIVLGNLVGLIDSDYQGQVYVSCWNRNTEGTPFIINTGDRIAQAVFLPIIEIEGFDIVTEFKDTTVRAEGGFNSTGVN